MTKKIVVLLLLVKSLTFLYLQAQISSSEQMKLTSCIELIDCHKEDAGAAEIKANYELNVDFVDFKSSRVIQLSPYEFSSFSYRDINLNKIDTICLTLLPVPYYFQIRKSNSEFYYHRFHPDTIDLFSVCEEWLDDIPVSYAEKLLTSPNSDTLYFEFYSFYTVGTYTLTGKIWREGTGYFFSAESIDPCVGGIKKIKSSFDDERLQKLIRLETELELEEEDRHILNDGTYLIDLRYGNGRKFYLAKEKRSRYIISEILTLIKD